MKMSLIATMLLLCCASKAQPLLFSVSIHERGNGVFVEGELSTSQPLNPVGLNPLLDSRSTMNLKLRIQDPTFKVNGDLTLKATGHYQQSSHEYVGTVTWSDRTFVKKLGVFNHPAVVGLIAENPSKVSISPRGLHFNLAYPTRQDPLTQWIKTSAPHLLGPQLFQHETLIHLGVFKLERWSFDLKPINQYKNLLQDPNMQIDVSLSAPPWVIHTNGKTTTLKASSGNRAPASTWTASLTKGTTVQVTLFRPGNFWEVTTTLLMLLFAVPSFWFLRRLPWKFR